MFSILNKRGLKMLQYNDFTYRKVNKTPCGQMWRCSKDSRCTAALLTDNAGEILLKTIGEHHHRPPAKSLKRNRRKNVKHEAVEEDILCESDCSIKNNRLNLENYKESRLTSLKECAEDLNDVLESIRVKLNEDETIEKAKTVDRYLNCEICKGVFSSKKELRHHIFGHLGQPRVVLNRVSTLRLDKYKPEPNYWLDPESKGSLKLTLKKQNYSDSLKLTFKKSPKSEDFTVTTNNIDTEINKKNDLAGVKKNDKNEERRSEDSLHRPFENLMVDQNDDDDRIKFKDVDNNPLGENERPSLDVNESDSGVGSDMANPSEKEDQNVDDLQRTESEDHEESSEALEATCRETIENLKILGEQSSSRSIKNPSPLGEPGEDEEEEEEEETEEDGPSDESTNVMHTLETNPAISIISKTTLNNHSTSNDKTENDFNWTQLSADLTNKTNNRKEHDNQSEGSSEGHIDTAAGSLLQNFLIEHQRNETSLSTNNLGPVETEYVSLERLAETVNACRVCNEKFKDTKQLDEHKTKHGHYRCNVGECANLIFHSSLEVSLHKSQIHNSNSTSSMSPHLTPSPQHSLPMESPNSNSNPLPSPTFNPVTSPHGQIIPPVNFDQLPAPVQQLAQQVQRMPLPNQMSQGLPQVPNTIMPGHNYYHQPPGRPPLYRLPTPQGMPYPPHMPPMYQYPPGAYSQMTGGPPPQMHPQLSQMRNRYPPVVQNNRAPRIPQQSGPVPRQRMKRPLQSAIPPQQLQPGPNLKTRRLDVLLPDRNEDADCHIIAQQKRNDGLPVIQNVQGATTQSSSGGRNDSTIHLTDSITLSVRQPGSAAAQVTSPSSTTPKKSDAKAVANVLAARGITVTPAANKNKTSEQNKTQMPSSPHQQRSTTSPQQPLNVTALNLNSAISIIPANLQKKQQEQGQFAIPQNKQKSPMNEHVERPPRPPTVDLTQDPAPQLPVVRRGRPPRAALTCQVCDKNFPNQEMLTQHMITHRAPSKLLHKCNLCPAQYPTAQALATHKQAYHKEVDSLSQNGGAELALPVVDLKSPHVLNRLSSLGIQSYIPLSQLSAQTGGYFGLPIITIDGARNPNTFNLGALGATSILSLGPLKHLMNRGVAIIFRHPPLISHHQPDLGD